MSETKTYAGGCHCGNVRYEVTTQELSKVMTCNCSICSKKGSALTFVPAEAFKLVSEKTPPTDYQFAKKSIHHLFCPICGVASYARGTGPDGKAMYAINARCLDDVDVSKLEVQTFDGKSL